MKIYFLALSLICASALAMQEDDVRIAQALHRAAAAGNLSRVKRLNREGFTATHLQHRENGRTARQVAESHGHQAIVQHLNEVYQRLHIPLEEPPVALQKIIRHSK